MRTSNERGIALITTMLVLMLISALLIGFTTVVISDQRYRLIDRYRGQAFYAASGALEKMTADLGNLFLGYVAPSGDQVNALTATTAKPTVTDVSFTAENLPDPLPAIPLTLPPIVKLPDLPASNSDMALFLLWETKSQCRASRLGRTRPT